MLALRIMYTLAIYQICVDTLHIRCCWLQRSNCTCHSSNYGSAYVLNCLTACAGPITSNFPADFSKQFYYNVVIIIVQLYQRLLAKPTPFFENKLAYFVFVISLSGTPLLKYFSSKGRLCLILIVANVMYNHSNEV